MHTHFLTTIIIILFYCYGKVFILMNVWMIGKNSVKWEKFRETSLPEWEDFYIHLNIENITDTDYMYTKRVRKGFKIKTLWEYHNLYVQNDTLLLDDVFENFRNTADFRLFEPALVRTSCLLEPFFNPRGYSLTSSNKNPSVIRTFSCSNFRLFEPISEPPWPIKLSVIRTFSFF